MRASEIIQLIGSPNSLTLRAAVVTAGAIDAVHTLPRSTRLIVRENRSRRVNGSYLSSRVRAEIVLSRKGLEPHLTFAHEFGHFLDDRVIQPYVGRYASAFDKEFQPLLEAWSVSAEVVFVQKLLAQRRRVLSAEERAFLAESLRVEELFARTYAQWLAHKSSHPALQEQLDVRLGTPDLFAGIPCRFQWEQESFKPIMAAVDQLFGSKGLL